MPTDLEERIKQLSPGALRIFRQKIATLPPKERQAAFSRLSGIQELSDIIGRPTPITDIEETRPKTQQKPVGDMSLWQRGLQAVNAPFDWISKNITEPFGAIATAPFTPGLPGGRQPGESALAYARRQYEQWEEPVLFTTPGGYKFRPTKGIVESLPWFALPSAGAVAGKLGAIAKTGGAVGKAAQVGANIAKPFAAAEALPGKVIGKALGKKPIPKVVYHNTTIENAEKIAKEGVKPGIPRIMFGERFGNEIGFSVSTDATQAAKYGERQVAFSISPVAKIALPKDLPPSVFKKNGFFNQSEVARLAKKQGFDGVDLNAFEQLTPEPGLSAEIQIFNPDILSLISIQAAEALPGKVLGKILPKKPPLISALIADGEALLKRAEPSNPIVIKFKNALEQAKSAATPDAQRLALREMERLEEQIKIKSIVSQAFPEGLPNYVLGSVGKITKLITKTKPLPAATARLRKPVRGRRAGTYEEQIQKLAEKGNLTPETEEAARKALAGKYPVASTKGYESIRESITGEDVRSLMKAIAEVGLPEDKEGFTRRNMFKALFQALDGTPLQTNQIQLLERVFGSGLAKALLSKQGWGEKAWRNVMSILNAPRALLASGDLSGLLLQGGILAARHPQEALKTVKPMIQAMLSDKNAMLMDEVIRTRKGMDKAIDVGLDILSLPHTVSAVPLKQTEEVFASTFMNKIFFVRGSNRAYTTVLNDLRSRTFLNTRSGWEKMGVKYVDDKALSLMDDATIAAKRAALEIYTDDDLKSLAKLVNWASGRGDLPGDLQKHTGIISAMFFAPKLIMSRLQFPTAVLPFVNKSKLARQEAWKQIGSFLGIGGSILAMAKLSGVGTVELDPRSTDFGKLKVGDTRIDIWTGYSQYLRVLAQLTTAQGKTVSGRISAKDRAELLWRAARSKYSPAVGLIFDWVNGETFIGEELSVKTLGNPRGLIGQIFQRTIPLALQDIVEGFNVGGVPGALFGATAIVGIRPTTYGTLMTQAQDKIAKQKYNMTWDEVGQKLGRAAQLELQQSDIKVSLPLEGITGTLADVQKEQDRLMATGKPSTMERFQNEGKDIEQMYRDEVTLASKEFRKNGDGVAFRTRVNNANLARRKQYALREKKKEYADIKAYYEQPLTAVELARMSPLDVARREFNEQMYAPDMYDEFGNYRFDEADKRENEFTRKYGQQTMDYIENYSGKAWKDKPIELIAFERAKSLLEPYWQINERVWAMYSPELKIISDQIDLMERTDPDRARLFLKRYPSILRARELIAQYKKRMRESNPMLKRAYQTFYGR